MDNLHKPEECASSDKELDSITADQKLARDRARSKGCWDKKGSEDAQKAKIQEILYELMDTGVVADAIVAIENNRFIEGIEFTKRALIFGIEHSSYERELISQLLSSAYNIFQGREIPDGFQLLLYRLPDFVLDVPNAAQILAKFISRANYDEILPPAFLRDAHIDNEWAKESLALAFATVHSSDEKRRLEHVWGPGDLTSVNELKAAVDQLLEEYFENPNAAEAASSVKELNTPSFGSQIVKQALRLALEKNTDKARTDVIQLLSSWNKMNLMSSFHMERGFQNVANQLDDLKLDVPNAGIIFPQLVAAAIGQKILSADFGK